jgi:hypothetical protein
MNDKIDIAFKVFEGLMARYKKNVPAVDFVLNNMLEEGIINSNHEIENDHVAFRTLGIPHLGIKSFEKIFIHFGYQKRDFYEFNSKKLNAYWFSPPVLDLPRIFVSELRINELSEEARTIILKYTKYIKEDPVDKLDLNKWEDIDHFLHHPLWEKPELKEYEKLQSESEYASWVIYNRYYLNHYTISVHSLKKAYNTIKEFNEFLQKIGVKLNSAGGEIKTSKDGLLIQSSTVAEMLSGDFANGQTKSISGSYVEFAERKVLPQFANMAISKITREHRRDGFEASNADKIFESTFSSQTLK